MGKSSKKNEEKTPVVPPKKGILAFFSSSTKKVSLVDKVDSPDSVQSVEALIEVKLTEHPPNQFAEIVCENENPLPNQKSNEVIEDPSKVFPLFQMKPKEKTISPTQKLDDIFDATRLPQSFIVEVHDDKKEDELLIADTAVGENYTLDQKHEAEDSRSEVETELQPNQLFTTGEKHDCFEEIEVVQQPEVKEPDVIELKEPEGEVKELEGGEYRRSARIRTKQVEIAKKIEEQMKLLESSDDDSYKLIKRDSGSGPKKRSARKTEKEYHSDEEPPASSKKKKVAAIFVSKEEKARLAAEEKERKAREAALLEQERLLKLAEERERRIQEEMKNIKQFNDERLGATKQENSASNPFFAARSNLKVISLIGEEGTGPIDSSAHDFKNLEDIESFPSLLDMVLAIQQDFSRAPILEDRRSFVILDSDYFSDGVIHTSSHRLYDAAVWDLSAFRSIWINYMAYLCRFSRKAETVIDISDEDNDSLKSHQNLTKSTYEQVLSGQRTKIMSWLESWKNRRLSTTSANPVRSAANASKRVHDDDDDSLADTISEFSEADEDEQLGRGGSSLNDDSLAVYVIVGGTGTGKTSLAYECAKAVGASVIEINSTQVRSAAVIKKLISEATQSTTINRDQIILFDEADVFFEEEDTGFHSAIVKLASSTKSPIIITVRKFPQSLYSLPANICVLQPPTHEDLAKTLNITLLPNKIQDTSEALTSLGLSSFFDVRGAINTLALYPDKAPLTQLSSSQLSLQYFLAQNYFDFSLFDAINIPSSILETVGHAKDEGSFTKAIFQPSLNCVFPHFVGVTSPEDTIITIQGENFLQTIRGELLGSIEEVAQVKVYVGSCEVRIIEHEDNEIRFLLPRSGLSRGFYSIRVQLSFNSHLLTPTVLSHSIDGGNEAWIVLSELYPMDFSKYLMTSCCRSYATFVKNNEVTKMFNTANHSTTTTKTTKKRKKSRLIRRQNVHKDTSDTVGEEEKAGMTDVAMDVDEDGVSEIDDDDDFLAVDESFEDNAGGKKKIRLMFEEDEDEDERDGDGKEVGDVDERINEEAHDSVKRRMVLLDDNEDSEENNTEEKKFINPEIPSEENEIDQTEIFNLQPVIKEDENLPTPHSKSIAEKLLEANQGRLSQPTKAVAVNAPASESTDALSSLETLSASYDYISSIDCITRRISDYTMISDEDVSPVFSSDSSHIIHNLESVRGSCYQEFGNYCQPNKLLHTQTQAFSTDFLHFQCRRAYKIHRFEYELSCFNDQSLNQRLVYSELLPYFHLIGSSSIIYEEKEKEFQRILDAEKKASSRSRRLQSNNDKNNTPINEGPSYQYVKERTHLEEESFKGLLEHFYDHLKMKEEIQD